MILIALSQIDVGMLVTIANLYDRQSTTVGVLEYAKLGGLKDQEELYILGHGEPGVFAVTGDAMDGNDLAEVLLRNGLADNGPKHVNITLVTCHSGEALDTEIIKLPPVSTAVFASLSKSDKLREGRVTVSVIGFVGPAVTDGFGVTRGKDGTKDASAYRATIKEFNDNKCQLEWDTRANTIKGHVAQLVKDVYDDKRMNEYLVSVTRALKNDTRLMFNKLYEVNKALVYADRDGAGVKRFGEVTSGPHAAKKSAI